MPRDGRAFVALLVGGSEHVRNEIAFELYNEFGIELRHQWPYPTDKMIPTDVEVVLILTDLCTRSFSRDATKAAKSLNLRVALIGRKKSAWVIGLQSSGFIQRPSWLKRKEAQGPKHEVVVPPAWKPPTPKPAGTNGTTAHQQSHQVAAEQLAKAAEAARLAEPPPPPPMSDVVSINIGSAFIADPQVLAKRITEAVQPMPRYVEVGTKQTLWADEHTQAFVRLAETWKGDKAEEFVEHLWRACGVYRTPATLLHRLRALMAVIKLANPRLPHLLEFMARKVAAHKKTFLLAEKAAMKRGEVPERISAEAALDLVGGIENRLLGKWFQYDRELGVRVCKSADVLEYVREMEQRGQDVHNTVQGYTEVEWEGRILQRLQEKGPLCTHELIAHSPRAKTTLEKLVKDGKVLAAPWNGGSMFRLPSQALPTPKPKTPPPRPPTRTPVVLHPEVPIPDHKIEFLDEKPQPKPDTRGARARVIAGLADGSIAPALAAALLKQLEEP